ncbi:MAG: hypothetical protein CMP11_05925 [Zetaproteobacteria bacterium]|nr:hypothetical protein [Pseudobdellovibrionaceae bacterium]|tara:strand:- start:497 stop:1624 length:1128 start_codon:yes stop_codon:yes gene_type:complete
MQIPDGTYQDALSKLEQFKCLAGDKYTRSRNYDFGPSHHQNVSGLSPYLARRVLLPHEVIKTVEEKNGKQKCAKFCQEIYWQTYWRGWLEMRPQVWSDSQDIKVDSSQSLKNAKNGTTGIDAFDFWVEELKSTGYLHNHARMWFASIWIHTLELDWKVGADFFFNFLCDADCASNTLSWRWVAGLHTKGKYYLADEENIKKYTKGRFDPKGLAKNPREIVDTAKLNEKINPSTLNTSDPSCDLWIIFPDDYSVHRTFDLLNKKVIIINPNLAFPWESGVVTQFNNNILKDLLDKVPHAKILNNLKDFSTYCEIGKVNSLCYIKPCVGIYHNLKTNILSHIDPKIKIYEVRRKWDNKYFVGANKGFFSFKKKFNIT